MENTKHLTVIKDIVLEKAKTISNAFMSHRSGKMNNPDTPWSDMSTRVKLVDDSLSIEWRRRWWIKKSDGKKMMNSNYIKKGAGYKYHKQTLAKNCKEWEIQEVIQTEEEFSKLRECWDLLKQAEKNLNKVLPMLDIEIKVSIERKSKNDHFNDDSFTES